jgi:hypothetical protein
MCAGGGEGGWGGGREREKGRRKFTRPVSGNETGAWVIGGRGGKT